jgi:hypothetical protein
MRCRHCVSAWRASAALAAAGTLSLAGHAALQGSSLGGSSHLNGQALAYTPAELAGVSISGFPYFRHVDGFHQGSTIQIALDVAAFPQCVGRACRVWVVADKSRARWLLDPSLVDVRGVAQVTTWTSGTLAANTLVIDSGTLAGDDADRLGRGYDVVLDFDFDGKLGQGDLIDGADGAGLWVIGEPTQPGPHAVTELLYSGGAFLGQDLYFPSDIASMGQLPVVVVSHGNGHDYRWYDHIGDHLASWGAIVMSHQNDTAPGPEAASTTTLTNTDYLLANQALIAGGALLGHVDSHRIVFIGHSRGGEGVVRAFRRLKEGSWLSPLFDWRDVVLVSSIAPTTQLTSDLADPGVVSFALLYGASDTDVSSAPFVSNSKPLAYFERAQGDHCAIYIQGAGHADFHDGGGPCWCAGPALIGPSATHDVMRGYYRALVELYAFNRPAAREFLTRSYQDFRPQGIPSNVIATTEYRDARALGAFVVDDFEHEPAVSTSSSGGTVQFDVLDYSEGELHDFDGSFAFSPGTSMNGMVCGRRDESPHGAVLEWGLGIASFVEFSVAPENGDVRGFDALSLRACQGTRHPQTDALNAPLSFTVALRDRFGNTSRIATAGYGLVTRTYLRTGAGPGPGWLNEFATLRIPLADFASNGSGVELGAIRAVRLEFGSASGSPQGRMGLDDVEFAPRRAP